MKQATLRFDDRMHHHPRCSLAYLLFLVLIFVTTLYATLSDGRLHQFNVDTYHYLEAFDSSTLFTQILSIIVFLGKTSVVGITTACILGYLAWQRHWNAAIFTVLLFTLGLSLVLAFKLAIHSPRPGIAVEWLGSFPSGHTARISLLFGVLAVLLNRSYPHKRLSITLICLLLPLSVGFARVAQGTGAHWLTDVIGSFALCLALIHILTYFYDKWLAADKIKASGLLGATLLGFVLGAVGSFVETML